ncbi:MAG TPA: hypothetical protein V6D50_15670 [Chroococcales cyanobacterium]
MNSEHQSGFREEIEPHPKLSLLVEAGDSCSSERASNDQLFTGVELQGLSKWRLSLDRLTTLPRSSQRHEIRGTLNR